MWTHCRKKRKKSCEIIGVDLLYVSHFFLSVNIDSDFLCSLVKVIPEWHVTRWESCAATL